MVDAASSSSEDGIPPGESSEELSLLASFGDAGPKSLVVAESVCVLEAAAALGLRDNFVVIEEEDCWDGGAASRALET